MSQFDELEKVFKRELRVRLLQERIVKKPQNKNFHIAESDEIDAAFLIGESLQSDFLSALWIQATGIFNLSTLMRLKRDDFKMDDEIILNPNTQWLKNTLQDLYDARVDEHLLIRWVQDVLKEIESKRRQ